MTEPTSYFKLIIVGEKDFSEVQEVCQKFWDLGYNVTFAENGTMIMSKVKS